MTFDLSRSCVRRSNVSTRVGAKPASSVCVCLLGYRFVCVRVYLCMCVLDRARACVIDFEIRQFGVFVHGWWSVHFCLPSCLFSHSPLHTSYRVFKHSRHNLLQALLPLVRRWPLVPFSWSAARSHIPQLQTLNIKPQTPNLKPQTLNPKPQTLKSHPHQTWTGCAFGGCKGKTQLPQ